MNVGFDGMMNRRGSRSGLAGFVITFFFFLNLHLLFLFFLVFSSFFLLFFFTFLLSFFFRFFIFFLFIILFCLLFLSGGDERQEDRPAEVFIICMRVAIVGVPLRVVRISSV